MSIKAPISSGYLLRLLLVGLVCIAFAAWSAYDGFVAYPEHNRAVDRLEEIKVEHPSDWQPLWEAEAAEKGWKTTPGERKSDWSVFTQYVMLGITGPIGLLFFGSWAAHRGRWIAADEQGIRTSRGVHVPFTSIQRIDKQRWSNKGIAVAWYDAGGGGEKKLIIDDWKYDRVPTDRILAYTESNLTREQIVNGEPEPVEDAQAPAEGS